MESKGKPLSELAIIGITSGIELVKLLYFAASAAAEVHGIPDEQTDTFYEASKVERKKRAASKLPDV